MHVFTRHGTGKNAKNLTRVYTPCKGARPVLGYVMQDNVIIPPPPPSQFCTLRVHLSFSILSLMKCQSGFRGYAQCTALAHAWVSKRVSRDKLVIKPAYCNV